jgi:hypothetical protein
MSFSAHPYRPAFRKSFTAFKLEHCPAALGDSEKDPDSCRLCGDGIKIRHPAAAAQFLSAYSKSAYEPGFLPCSKLSHFYTDAKFRSKELDQLPEIHPFISDVIKNSFCAVSLEFNIPVFI